MRLIWKNNGAAPVDSLEVGCRPARPALGEVPGPGQTHLMAQFYFLPLTHTLEKLGTFGTKKKTRIQEENMQKIE